MDHDPISISFTDAWTMTLPIQMPHLIEESHDPGTAALSTLPTRLRADDRLLALHRMAEP